MSDEEIYRLASSSPKIDFGSLLSPDKPAGKVTRIAPDTVAKARLCASEAECERAATELVRRSTPIPVPRCDRLTAASGHPHCPGAYLLQQFVPGRRLHDAWPSLGLWTRFRVYVTVRYYIHQLRRLSERLGTPPFPGPPSVDDGQPNMCVGRLFNESGSGPFSSHRELSRWYQNRLLVMQRFLKKGLGVAPFDGRGPLVFTHLDLHPANLILGDDGQLWVIDWADAGWYPPWFEAASMTLFARTHPDTPSSWSSWIPFMAGSCDKPGQLPFIEVVSFSLVCMPPNIMNLIDSEES